MAGFDYIGRGAPTFGGPAVAPAEYFDIVGRVIYVWDGVSGRWLPEPGTNSSLDNVAAAGTTQVTATPITGTPTAINVTTVAAGTGIALFPSWTGAEITINNNQGTNALLVYPNGAETVNGNPSVSIPINSILIFYCFTAGKWFTK